MVRIKIAKIITIGEIWVQIHMLLADIVYCKLQEDKIFVIVEIGFKAFHIVCFCIVCNTCHRILFDIVWSLSAVVLLMSAFKYLKIVFI